MNCHECARQQRDTVAVAICLSCGAALCLEHRQAEQTQIGPGGTSIGCSHELRPASPTTRQRHTMVTG